MAQYRAEIAAAAATSGVAADLLAAIVQVESSGNPWAWNPEPRYRYLVDARTGHPFRKLTAEENSSEVPPADFPTLAADPDQEWWAQQASWGLMQVMGAVAREQGCREPFLTALCDPTTNLAIGARVVRGLLLWADGDIFQACAAYNGGRGGWKAPTPTRYAEKVLRALSHSSVRG